MCELFVSNYKAGTLLKLSDWCDSCRRKEVGRFILLLKILLGLDKLAADWLTGLALEDKLIIL